MVAMTHVGYVLTGWGIALAALAGYARWTVRRGRALAEQVQPEDRRWS